MCSPTPVKWGKEGRIHANERGWELSRKSAEARIQELRERFWEKSIKHALTKMETEESQVGVQTQSHTSASSHKRDSRRQSTPQSLSALGLFFTVFYCCIGVCVCVCPHRHTHVDRRWLVSFSTTLHLSFETGSLTKLGADTFD